MDLGSSQWANPTASFGQGVTQGAGLALSLNQAVQQKKQAEWERDFHSMEVGFKFAENKNVSPESSARVLNGLKPIWDKWNPKAPFPEITPANVEDFKPIISNGINLYKDAATGKGGQNFTSALAELQQQMAGFNTRTAAQKDVTDKQKAAFDEVLAPLKAGADAETKAKEAKAKAAEEFTPEKALARMSDLTRQDADLQKLDQQNALMMSLMGEKGQDVSKFKVDAAALATRRASVTNEMIQLNTHLPKETQRIVIDSAQVDAIKNKLATRGVQGDKADEFIAANYLVRPSGTGPQQGPQAPPAAPQ